MNLDWLSWTNTVSFWWVTVVSISIVNILFWLWTKYFLSTRYDFDDYDTRLIRTQVLLSSIYVFVCAYRSVFPKADVQRICLFDTWLSSVFLGRSLATVAELAFVLQWALALKFFSQTLKNSRVEKLSSLIVPLIVSAECFSWFAVITTNYLGNTIEESHWAVTYGIILISIASLIPHFKREFKYAMGVAIFGCAVYISFMSLVDVPMYFSRWLSDSANGKVYFGLMEGLTDLNTRWVVTHDIQNWKQEIPWKTLYFSLAVWVSMSLCYLPYSKKKLRRFIADGDEK